MQNLCRISRFRSTLYALAHFVDEKDGKDILAVYGVRYYDKYVKKNGKWRIAEREQYFVFSDTRELKNEN